MHTVTDGPQLYELLITHARTRRPTAPYTRCVIQFTESVLDHLLRRQELDVVIEALPSLIRNLVGGATRDRESDLGPEPYSIDLVELAIRMCEGATDDLRELITVLGYAEDGLFYERDNGRWWIVSRGRFEEEMGFAVKIPAGSFLIGLPFADPAETARVERLGEVAGYGC